MRIAVVGSGISGLAAAFLLSRRHEVHLFERDARLGGHTHTVRHDAGGRELALDTGFIVCNERTYPLLNRLFAEIGVSTQPSDMSFSVTCRRPDLEFAGAGLAGLLAQPANLLRPSFLGMVRDILRLRRVGSQTLAHPDPEATLADFLGAGGFGDAFGRFYLVPMAAAIWSTGVGATTAFPRDSLLHFLDNHGLLSVTGHPQWRTVVGGSSSYIPALIRPLGERVHAGLGVRSVERGAQEVVLHLDDGSRERFDQVVIAAHADQALAMLADPGDDERELLGAWSYGSNETWLHTDTGLLPRRRRAWAAWNVLLEDAAAPGEKVAISYWLNRLQALDEPQDYVVTLNPPRPPRPETVLQRMTYRHPTYTREAVASQDDLPRLGGRRRTWFAGAYHRWGFHEDGLWSAVRVAAELGAPW